MVGLVSTFVQGVIAAPIGALSRAVVKLAIRAVFDLPTTAIGMASLLLLWRLKLSEPAVALLSGGVGLPVLLLKKG